MIQFLKSIGKSKDDFNEEAWNDVYAHWGYKNDTHIDKEKIKTVA